MCTDTTAILSESLKAEMVLHPEIQHKVPNEVDAALAIVCSDELKLARSVYLQAEIKDTLRLHPPKPLLRWARLRTQDVCVATHHVPADTTAVVNMYAMTHDPALWPQSESIVPEHYLEQDVDVGGSELGLAPFGVGHRVCPGRALGLAGCSSGWRSCLWEVSQESHEIWTSKRMTPRASTSRDQSQFSYLPPALQLLLDLCVLSYSPSNELDIDAHESLIGTQLRSNACRCGHICATAVNVNIAMDMTPLLKGAPSSNICSKHYKIIG